MTAEETGSDIQTNILLVDDRPQNLVALEAILEPLGQNLVLANSGLEALKHVLQMDFAVILLDVLMPNLDGFETATLIKQREQSKSIPIIFLTAVSTHDNYVFQGYSVGAVDYLAKPFDVDILRSKVSVFVDLFRKNVQIKRQAALIQQSQVREREAALAELQRKSDQRYQSLAASMPQIVWSADAQGVVTFCNQPWFDAANAAPRGPVSAEWRAAIHPADFEGFAVRWSRAIETGQDFESECRFRRGDSPVFRWHLVRVSPVFDADDGRRIASWLGTSTDIDDRRHAQETLRFLAEASTVLSASLDYRSTIPHVAQLSVPAIADWCIVDLREDDGALRRLAVAHAEPRDAELARRIASLRPREPDPSGGSGLEARPAEATRAFVDCASDGETAAGNGWWPALGLGSCVYATLHLRGRVLGRVALATAASRRAYSAGDQVLVQDLARRLVAAVDNAQLYEIAQRERASLERANRAKDEFLAIVSHELRTPLNAVLGWAQLLRRGGLDAEELARGLETIERNARSQAQLIGDMLDVSRIISGKLALSMRPLDLAVVVRAVVESIRPEAQGKGLHLDMELPNASVTVSGDAERLQQIVRNLLSNSIKFTPGDGRVSVKLSIVGDRAVLDVTDSGVGIPSEFLPHVFDRFSQGDASHSRAHTGLGLGLSIVKHLVEMHGGSVRATSAGAGRGATFTIELALSDEQATDDVVSLPLRDSRRSARRLAGLRLLVVEDVKDGRDFLKTTLELCGAHVTAVASVPEALAAIAQAEHDLLVSDIGLAGESGYDLMRRVRALPEARRARMPAVALTAYAAEADRQRALDAGFQAHMAKPFDNELLVALIERLASALDAQHNGAS